MSPAPAPRPLVGLESHARRATAIVERLAGVRAPLDGVTAMQELGQREKVAATIWLRRHVDAVRVDLGLPTRGEQAVLELRVNTKKFVEQMTEVTGRWAGRKRP